MVQLTMTAALVAAIERIQANRGDESTVRLEEDGQPELDNQQIGRPITHSQILAVSRRLRNQLSESRAVEQDADATPSQLKWRLEDLLRGSKVYIEAPKAKPKPTSEYKALMARLRRDEEAQAYERMLNPPSLPQTFTQRFPRSSPAYLFPESSRGSVTEEDEMTYSDVSRQMALIINVLVSIVACSVAIWMATWSWSVPKRLGASMGGSGIVAIAEVAVYAGYIRRLSEAKDKERKKPEAKEITDTWIILGKGEKADGSEMLTDQEHDNGARKRIPHMKS